MIDASGPVPETQRAAWFEHLRDDICAAFEALEDALPAGAPLPIARPAASCARRGSAPTIPASRAAAA